VADPKIRITADTSQAERQIEKLGEALANIEAVSGAATKALAVVTAAAGALAFATVKTLDSVGALADTAKSLGTTVQSLQAFQNSAILAGVGADEFTNSLRKLQANIGDALVKGTGPATDALKRLNLTAGELSRLGADQQFARIAAAINQLPTPAERSAAALDLLGKQGPRLLEAAENAERLKREAEALGIALSDFDVRAIEQAGDSLDELKFIAEGALQKAIAEIAPLLIAVARNIKAAVEEAGGFEAILKDRLLPAIRLLTQAAAVLFTILAAAKFVALIGFVARTVAAMVTLTKAIRAVGIAAATMQAIATGGLSAILTLTLGVAGAIAAATVAGNAFDSALGDAAGVAKEIKEEVEKAGPPLNANAEAADRLNDAMRKALEAFDDTVTKLQQSAQYQRDVLNLGEQEATVRKTIAEEAAKLQKVGLSITTDQEKRLRTAIEEENSIKRQIQLRSEQASAAFGAILGGQSPVEKELQKQLEFRLLMEGKSADDIKKIREEQFRTDKRYRQMAEASMEQNLQNTIIGEIAKNNQLYAIKTRHTKEIQDLDNFALSLQVNNIRLSAEQEAALLQGKEDLYRKQQLERLEFDRQIADQRLKLELDRINKVLEAENNGRAAVLSQQDQAILRQVGQSERQKRIASDRVAFEKKTEGEKAQFAIDQGAQMFSALGAQNKKAFEAAKAFNIANAIMNTYMAATKALATYPPPFSFIAAAAAIGLGLAQVAQIRAQQYSGRQLGGPVMGGQPYLVGENGPELFTPNATGSITRNSDLGGAPVNISFNIQANDAEGFDDLLIQRRGMIQQMVSDAITERGQRSML
jgi:hypothetical protein